MEATIKILSFALLTGLFLSPVLIAWWLYKQTFRYNFIIYLMISVLATAAITLTFAWWVDNSDQLLLEHYKYSFSAMNDTERFGNVSPDNIQKVKNLEMSIMGIGWPLKAIMFYVFYSPYLLIVYLVAYFIKTKTTQMTENNECHVVTK